VDFVDFIYPAALALSEGRVERAILVDGAGYPSGIVANMLPGVFAAVANDLFSARLSREHSDTNALCIGGKVVGAGVGGEIVETWLKTAFLGGKYAVRVGKVRQIAAHHRRPLEERARQVLTVQDVRDALTRRESLLLDEKTILTPSVLDLLR
jgi:ribose 5-phosphate isomerase B